MSHLLMSASSKLRLPRGDSPLNLSLSKYESHTCERFVQSEDLRSETLDATDDDGTTGSNRCDSICIKRNAETAPRFLQFSIDAILQDTKQSPPGYSSHAVATSALSPNFELTNSGCQSSRVELPVCDVFWCHVCNAFYLDDIDAKNHHTLHCVKGDKCNLRKSLLVAHGCVSRNARLNEEKIHCSLCDKSVSQCFFIKYQRLHDGHICDVCRKEFSTNSRLKDHMNVHLGAMPFSCTMCDRNFSKRSSLTQQNCYHRDH
ncbi:oocyte zinc finger protein XlCOF6-like [Dreissena polymorpha]|uniref:C2H2-type domain-containing protein n=1 Tax=Dreissena polymorpha TaxID=45954 RepID=A0A9D3YPI5_DREPO|nr:oocyte zinc finger protein XlCOF6-like [Dreissena polymorpha]XP_052253299.1 oocyte zinc finger protein XlCOF6-like [Dreissena polymorpha]KAH3702803.1 hypothetical protein DPMN_077829 [Dreissena polymorpha]